MKTHDRDFSADILARAVRLALVAMFAAPALAAAQGAADAKAPAAGNAADQAATADGEGDVKNLVCPTNYFEAGALGVSKTAPKFGEYNGLHRSGGYGVGNFSVSGGDGYCQRGGAMRWTVHGANLGTTSRDLGASVGEQGKWSVGIGFDQLRHYTTTGYQTPLQGSMGGNTFVLPPAAVGGLINNQSGIGTQRITGPFPRTDIYSERKTTTFNAGYAFNTEWNFKFDYKHLEQSGAKLMAAGTDTTTFDGVNYRGQGILTLMAPTQYNTDNFKFTLNWTGEKAYASIGYHASLFRDDYRGIAFSNPYVGNGVTLGLPPGAFPLDFMGTPPNNQLHRVDLAGGYIFSPATKLTGGLSLGVNTQNSSYDGTYTPGTVQGLPVPSLSGKVENTHADARLTHRVTPDLNLNAGFKYNERNNKTPSYTYSFYHLGTNTALSSPTNTPMSNRREQFDANVDYRLDKRQMLHFGYAHDHIDRWCNNALANNAVGAYPSLNTTATCAQVPKSRENSLTAGYRLTVLEGVSLNASYTHADRRATVNPSFYNPMQSFVEGYSFTNIGYLAYFQASRREDMLKAGATWRPNNKFTLGLTGRYAKDDYYDSPLGVQNGKSASVNLSADYATSDDASYGTYLSWQRRSRDLLAASTRPSTAPFDPTSWWSNTMTDRDASLGIYGKQKLLHGKLTLSEDFSYGLGTSRYGTWLVAGTAATAPGSYGSTPDIKSKTIQLRLTGSYQLDKVSSVTVGYMFQRLKVTDYLYNGYQYGATPIGVMPSGLQAPSYNVHAMFVTYRRNF